MRGRLLAVLMTVMLVLLVVPVLGVAFFTDSGQPPWVAFGGAQLLAVAVLARAMLLSRRPRHEPSSWDVRTRWWRAGSAVAVVVATIVIVVGLVLRLPPRTALAVALVVIAIVAVTTLLLDRYAAKVARVDPPDVEQPEDGDRLEPMRLRATLRRRFTWSVGVGLVVGTAAAATLGLLERPGGEVLLAGATSLALACFATSATLLPLQLAAARRLTSFSAQHHAASVRATRRAVLRGHVDSLDPEAADLAVGWARAAQPSLLLQLVTSAPLWAGLLLTQGPRLAEAPLSLLLPMVAALLTFAIALVMSARQYRRVVRTAALAT